MKKVSFWEKQVAFRDIEKFCENEIEKIRKVVDRQIFILYNIPCVVTEKS